MSKLPRHIDWNSLFIRLNNQHSMPTVHKATGINITTLENYKYKKSKPNYEYAAVIFNYALDQLGANAVRECCQ